VRGVVALLTPPLATAQNLADKMRPMAAVEEYGIQEDRPRAIRWELAAVFSFWALKFALARLIPSTSPTSTELTIPRPWWSDVIFWAPYVLIAWIVYLSGDSPEHFGFIKPKWWQWALGAVVGVLLMADPILREIRHPTLVTTAQYLRGKDLSDWLGLKVVGLVHSLFSTLLYYGYFWCRFKEVTRSRFAAVLLLACILATPYLTGALIESRYFVLLVAGALLLAGLRLLIGLWPTLLLSFLYVLGPITADWLRRHS
jgi:hypothetical protein